MPRRCCGWRAEGAEGLGLKSNSTPGDVLKHRLFFCSLSTHSCCNLLTVLTDIFRPSPTGCWRGLVRGAMGVITCRVRCIAYLP